MSNRDDIVKCRDCARQALGTRMPRAAPYRNKSRNKSRNKNRDKKKREPQFARKRDLAEDVE
ncbi:TPA: hypothetical protein QDA71_003076 [Burkholderia vietnamiensis]|uniref:hypothetical protein n=1 Tax=Burkholderia vietnamiensis TaxID=60552 RepID=UPI00076D0EE3|nr:hypothetical protein [Burkholderia vietnamiensis]KVF28862.1 hypothetical protein WJ08_21725 [Burkholderia vietnamiensis]MBR8162174.1 hypothetical protein [Burkholderia vietnamiensis]MCA8147678.1 hypothetical protein [Burkholderia vietnamiensis]HDR8946073.1 hypothetical protein [Burkholderia vietnamiensis]HDR9207533.1 hypothetical protein [Burkholderia vietnamiensis]